MTNEPKENKYIKTRQRLWQILETGNSKDPISVYTDIFLIMCGLRRYPPLAIDE